MKIWEFLRPDWRKILVTIIIIIPIALFMVWDSYSPLQGILVIFINPALAPITIGVPYLISCIIVHLCTKLKQGIVSEYNTLKSHKIKPITKIDNKIDLKNKLKFNKSFNLNARIKKIILFSLLFIVTIIIGYLMHLQIEYNVIARRDIGILGILEFLSVVFIIPFIVSYSIIYIYEKYRGERK